jgi:hypothetical protein
MYGVLSRAFPRDNQGSGWRLVSRNGALGNSALSTWRQALGEGFPPVQVERLAATNPNGSKALATGLHMPGSLIVLFLFRLS